MFGNFAMYTSEPEQTTELTTNSEIFQIQESLTPTEEPQETMTTENTCSSEVSENSEPVAQNPEDTNKETIDNLQDGASITKYSTTENIALKILQEENERLSYELRLKNNSRLLYHACIFGIGCAVGLMIGIIIHLSDINKNSKDFCNIALTTNQSLKERIQQLEDERFQLFQQQPSNWKLPWQ